MATYTDNYQFEKPVASDSVNVAVLNRNSDKLDTILHASQVSIADAYDETETYAVGDVVMYEFFLYRCVTAVDTPETFDPTKWERTTAATSGSSGGASALTDLTDVEVSSPSNGQVLKYDSTSEKWVNGTGGGGAGYQELTQAEYDALTEAQKNNGTIYFITDGQGGGSGGSGTTYTVISDTTQTTNAWVNPIIVSCNPLDYDVIIFDISDSGTGRFYCITFPHTLPLDSGTGDDCKGYALQGNLMAYPARFSDGMGMFTSTNTTLNVNKVTGIKFGGGESSEISYSTTEHKIGTWIDGSDLYERTFDLSSVQMSDNTWYNNILGTNGSGIVIQSWEGYFIAFGGRKVEYRYYRSSTEYMTSVINSDGDDISVRPNLSDSNPIYQGVITIRYTKPSA